jgi:hypothetical protein
MPTSHPSNETVFETALEITDAAAREVFLDNICNGDQERCAKIKKLIAAHDKAEQFFHDCQPALTSLADPPATETERIIAEAPGMLIGVYKLLQKIGEGGCGTVYLAEQ